MSTCSRKDRRKKYICDKICFKILAGRNKKTIYGTNLTTNKVRVYKVIFEVMRFELAFCDLFFETLCVDILNIAPEK